MHEPREEVLALWHKLLRDARFHELLLEADREIAAEARRKGCPVCAGRLHGAAYGRKPRSGVALPVTYDVRFSFCCAEEGCCKRTTPVSLRFLGRRVYLALIVVLVPVLRQGPSRTRVQRLQELVGVSPAHRGALVQVVASGVRGDAVLAAGGSQVGSTGGASDAAACTAGAVRGGVPGDGSSWYGFMSMSMISKRPLLSVSPSAKPMVLAVVRSNGAASIQPSGLLRNASSGVAKSLPTRMSRRPSPSGSVSSTAGAWAWDTRRSGFSAPPFVGEQEHPAARRRTESARHQFGVVGRPHHFQVGVIVQVGPGDRVGVVPPDELPRRDALEGCRGKADIGAPHRGPVAGVGEHQVEPAIAVDVHSVDRATAVDIPAHHWPRAIRPRLPRTSRYLPSCFSDRNSPLTNGEEPCHPLTFHRRLRRIDNEKASDSVRRCPYG